jgi:hypothetical protein
MIIPTFLSTGDDTTVPSSSILSEPFATHASKQPTHAANMLSNVVNHASFLISFSSKFLIVLQAHVCQIHTYCNITPKGEFHVFIFICIDFVDSFTDATHKLIVSLSSKQIKCSTEESP